LEEGGGVLQLLTGLFVIVHHMTAEIATGGDVAAELGGLNSCFPRNRTFGVRYYGRFGSGSPSRVRFLRLRLRARTDLIRFF
jgi:hypothetical protein